MSGKLYKVWDHSRQRKKLVLAQSLEELLSKAALKLTLTGKLRAVFGSDGTDIEDDECLNLLSKDDVIVVLETHQQWEEPNDVRTIYPPNECQVENHVTIDDQSQASTSGNRTVPDNSIQIEPAFKQPFPNEPVPSKQPQPTPDNSKTSFALPTLSEYVRRKMMEGESHVVWSKLIQECAYYYLAVSPCIDIENSLGDYREIGREMFNAYPCIERDGTHPWSFFTKTLSQKIRRIRWDNKRKSRIPPEASTSSSSSSPKRLRVGSPQPSEECDQETYESHVTEMAQEINKKEPNITHMKTLLKATFPRRKIWIEKLSPGSVQPIVEKFPCFKNANYVMAELKLIMKFSSVNSIKERFDMVFRAVASIKKMPSGKTDIDILKMVEAETRYKQVKGHKQMPIIHIVQLEGDDIEKYLSTPPKSAPRLVALKKDGEINNTTVVADGIYILLNTHHVTEALTLLLAVYYISDLDYPRVYSQVLGFHQQLIFQQPFEGQKSNNYIQFLKKVTVELEKQ